MWKSYGFPQHNVQKSSKTLYRQGLLEPASLQPRVLHHPLRAGL